jgi:hypothetical protein
MALWLAFATMRFVLEPLALHRHVEASVTPAVV